MIVDHLDRRTVRSAIELAGRAPSVHNSQPWHWMLGDASVHLYADRARLLPVTDADGRDMIVSCGAALHHLRVALAACGIAARVHRTPNPDDPDHLAAVELHAGTPAEADLGLASAIMTRRTDRRRFSDWALPEGFVEELAQRASDQGALLRPISDPRARRQVVAAMAEAERLQQARPGYRTETALWTGRSGAVDDGIPAANLLRDAGGTGDGTARQLGEGLVEQPPGSGTDGAELLVLGTASDDLLSRLRAGEALSAVLLHATELGLATCPLSLPLEVDQTRAFLRDEVLGGTLSPHLVLRLGWAPHGPALPPTPRRPLDDVVERLPS